MKMTDAGAQARAALTARGKGINGALLMDAEDTYDQKHADRKRHVSGAGRQSERVFNGAEGADE